MKLIIFAAFLLLEVVSGDGSTFLRSIENTEIPSENKVETYSEIDCPVLQDDHIKGKPNDVNRRKKFFDYFEPCGTYEKSCHHQVIPPNIDYPGSGSHDISPGEIYIVQFDVGVDPILKGKVYDTLPQEWKNNCIGCNDKPNLPGKNKNITKTENGETCIEVIMKIGSSLGDFLGSKGGCVGKCGPGCNFLAGGYAKDCAKHDVCSAYKLLVTKKAYQNPSKFCGDPDCGDEAAQTVMNCFEHRLFWGDPVKVCHKSDFDRNEDYYGHWSMGTSFFNEGNCGNFVGWEAHQGIPPKNRIQNPYKMLKDGRMVPIDFDVDEEEVDYYVYGDEETSELRE